MIHVTLARRSAALIALAGLAGATLAGCSPADDASQDTAAVDDAAEAGDAGWPRTIEHDGEEIEIPAAPERIVALSTETGDIALDLAGHERVAAVSNGSATEGVGNAYDEAVLVETVLPSGTTPEPEQILDLGPDLVLMTGRHSGEEDAAGVLGQTGVPTIVFESADFGTPEAVAASVRLLGEALGAEDIAEDAAAALEEQVAAVEGTVADGTDQPRVLGLMARGDSVMITGIGSTLTTLSDLAGGAPVAVEEGWRGTVPADPEHIVATAPDVILIEDFRGAGSAPFDELLASAALEDVPAVANGEVHTVSSSIASGSSGLRLGDGLRRVAEILHPETF